MTQLPSRLTSALADRYRIEPFLRTFDVGPGDSTFVWFRGPTGAHPLRVVEGFFRELEERAGPGGGR